MLQEVFFKQGQGISLSGRVRSNKLIEDCFKTFLDCILIYLQILSKCFGENPQSPAPPFLGAVLPLRWNRNIVSFIFFYVDV